MQYVIIRWRDNFCLPTHSVAFEVLHFSTNDINLNSAELLSCMYLIYIPGRVNYQNIAVKRKLCIWRALLMRNNDAGYRTFGRVFLFCFFCSTAGCVSLIQFSKDECFPLHPLWIAYPQEATRGLNSIDPWYQNLSSWNFFMNLSLGWKNISMSHHAVW